MQEEPTFERVLTTAIQAVLPPLAARPLIAVETGGDGSVDEALASTAIVVALNRRWVPWRFLKSCATPEHVERVARLIAGCASDLLRDVEFVLDSRTQPGPALDRIDTIDFGWIHPAPSHASRNEIAVWLRRLSENGLLIVEDAAVGELPRDGGPLDAFRATLTVNGRHLLLVGRHGLFPKLLALLRELDLQVRPLARLPASASPLLPSSGTPDTFSTTAEEISLRACWAAARKAFPHITTTDFARAIAAIMLIEDRILGRHCGDLGDKLTQYLSVVDHVRRRDVRTVRVLEIGTLFGGSCLMHLIAMRDLGVAGKVTCIDPLAGYYGSDVDPHTGLSVDRPRLYTNLARCGFSPESIDLRQNLSSDPEAVEGLELGAFAILMIDGDHSAAGIQHDWDRYSRFVCDGGTVLIDDYADVSWPDITVVADALSRSSDQWRRADVFGTTMILAHQNKPGERVVVRDTEEDISPSLGAVVHALRADRYADAHWSKRYAGFLKHLRQWFESDLQFGLGCAAAARQDVLEARRAFNAVIVGPAAMPQVVIRAWIGMADCALEQGSRKEALACLDAAVALEKRLLVCGPRDRHAAARMKSAVAERAIQEVHP